MATNFPSSLDAFTNPSSADTLDNPPHDQQHADVNDAVEALQAKVGVDGSAVTTSLDARVNGSPAVLVYDFGGQALTGSTYNVINFDRESYDTHGMHDTSTLNERITIPSGWSGYYNVFWGGVLSTGTGQLSLFVPGGGVPIIYGDGGTERSACSAVVYLSAGQSIQIQAYPSTNSTLYGAGTIGGISPFFGATWLRP